MEASTSSATSTKETSSNNERKTVKTRLLVLSDTHAAFPFPPSDKTHAYRLPLPDADVILHAGDLTNLGYRDEYIDTINLLKAHPAELKLVIAGNHDITLDETYVLGPHGHRHAKHTIEDCRAVKEMWCCPEVIKSGIRYLEEGTHSFELQKNGATFTIYASPHQPVFDNWAFNYPRHQDRFNPSSSSNSPLPSTLLSLALNPVPNPPPSSSSSSGRAQPSTQPITPISSHPKIDLLLTHGPPLGILDTVAHPPYYNVGCAHLLRAVERARPLLHVFGHIHEGWGACKLDWSTGRVQRVAAESHGDSETDGGVGIRFDLSDEAEGEGDGGVKWGQETFFINASIMDVNYRAVHPPCVVDLDLPARKQAEAEPEAAIEEPQAVRL